MLGWMSIEPGMTVLREPLPPEGDGTLALAPLVLLLLVFSVLYAIRRRRIRKRTGSTLTSFALGAAVGNALLELNAIFQPDRPAVMTTERDLSEPTTFGDGRIPGPHPAATDHRSPSERS
ncbi:MAG: hypothetical protein AAF799_15720 [Myxococcota bacterium]